MKKINYKKISEYLSHENRKLRYSRWLYGILTFILVIILILIVYPVSKIYIGNEIIINPILQGQLDDLFLENYPKEYVSCIDLVEENQVKGFYVPKVEYNSETNITYQRCFTNAHLHSHPTGGFKASELSEQDLSNLEIDKPSCVQYDIDKIRCYKLVELRVKKE